MITAKTISSYGFTDLQGYFGYILDSLINGQFEQSSDLIYAMGKKQIALFINYCDNSLDLGMDKEIKTLRTMAINILTCK